MAIDYEKLGHRISYFRGKRGYSQRTFTSKINTSRNHLSQVEIGRKYPSLDLVVEIANALDVSADDLLVDSLNHSSSNANSELHLLLLDCNETEESILVELAKYMKAVLRGLGI